MKGLRWTLAFLRDPISALGSSIATLRERLAPLGSEMRSCIARPASRKSRAMSRDMTSRPARSSDAMDRTNTVISASTGVSGRLRDHVSTAAALTLLSGCSSAPSRNILGSYFPSWMICALIGMGATVAVRALLAKTGIDAVLPMPIVVYLAFATAFSLATWLLWLA